MYECVHGRGPPVSPVAFELCETKNELVHSTPRARVRAGHHV